MTANKEQDDSGGTLGGDECWILPVEKGSRTNSPPPQFWLACLHAGSTVGIVSKRMDSGR